MARINRFCRSALGAFQRSALGVRGCPGGCAGLCDHLTTPRPIPCRLFVKTEGIKLAHTIRVPGIYGFVETGFLLDNYRFTHPIGCFEDTDYAPCDGMPQLTKADMEHYCGLSAGNYQACRGRYTVVIPNLTLVGASHTNAAIDNNRVRGLRRYTTASTSSGINTCGYQGGMGTYRWHLRLLDPGSEYDTETEPLFNDDSNDQPTDYAAVVRVRDNVGGTSYNFHCYNIDAHYTMRVDLLTEDVGGEPTDRIRVRIFCHESEWPAIAPWENRELSPIPGGRPSRQPDGRPLPQHEIFRGTIDLPEDWTDETGEVVLQTLTISNQYTCADINTTIPDLDGSSFQPHEVVAGAGGTVMIEIGPGEGAWPTDWIEGNYMDLPGGVYSTNNVNEFWGGTPEAWCDPALMQPAPTTLYNAVDGVCAQNTVGPDGGGPLVPPEYPPDDPDGYVPPQYPPLPPIQPDPPKEPKTTWQSFVRCDNGQQMNLWAAAGSYPGITKQPDGVCKHLGGGTVTRRLPPGPVLHTGAGQYETCEECMEDDGGDVPCPPGLFKVTLKGTCCGTLKFCFDPAIHNSILDAMRDAGHGTECWGDESPPGSPNVYYSGVIEEGSVDQSSQTFLDEDQLAAGGVLWDVGIPLSDVVIQTGRAAMNAFFGFNASTGTYGDDDCTEPAP